MEHTQRGFSIILMEEDAMVIFSTSICISCFALVDQINCKPRLICTSSQNPDDITLSVHASTDKALAPKVMKFGACLARLLQKI